MTSKGTSNGAMWDNSGGTWKESTEYTLRWQVGGPILSGVIWVSISQSKLIRQAGSQSISHYVLRDLYTLTLHTVLYQGRVWGLSIGFATHWKGRDVNRHN